MLRRLRQSITSSVSTRRRAQLAQSAKTEMRTEELGQPGMGAVGLTLRRKAEGRLGRLPRREVARSKTSTPRCPASIDLVIKKVDASRSRTSPATSRSSRGLRNRAGKIGD
jgi:hypothetical protein